MPHVRLEITDEGVADGDKAEMIAGVTQLLQRVLGKDPATTSVVIDEVPWRTGGSAASPSTSGDSVSIGDPPAARGPPPST